MESPLINVDAIYLRGSYGVRLPMSDCAHRARGNDNLRCAVKLSLITDPVMYNLSRVIIAGELLRF